MKSFIRVCSVLLVLSFMDLCLCGAPVNLTVKSGENVTLSCKAAGNGKVSVVRLTRGDLKPDSVLLYRNDKIDEEQQNPQYLGRTKLQNFISTDGKINLTLDDVTEKDSGVYECRVLTETKSNTRRKRAAIESTFINLRVAAAQSDPPGRGLVGLVAGLIVAALVISLAAVFVLKKTGSFRSLSLHDEDEKPQNVDISRTFHWSCLFSHDGKPAIRKPMTAFHPDAGSKPGKMGRRLCEEVCST